ncbi:MAG: DUF1616 domain-containing protein [Candidatus Nezhaarchaeales archaeon]
MKLWELVVKRAEEKGLLGACLELYRQWVEGEIEVEDPSPPSSLFSYFVRLDYNLWLWLLLTLSALTITVVTVTEAGLAVLLPARYVLGTIAVLFLPGYALVEALYPRGDELSPLERLALSIGLSLAVVPLVGLVLNYTPFGIRLYPVLASLTLLTDAIAFIGAFRKYRYVSLLARGARVGAR